ncbi:MAG: pilin [Candidatus Saccharimonadales bacterium]
MITQIRTKLATVAGLFLLALVPVMASPAGASAQATDLQNKLCSSVDTLSVNGTGTCETTTTEGADKLNNIISTIVNIFSVLVGVIAVIMIIWGGLRYITSGGDSGKITSAKNTIIYALIGLIVVALAQFIVKFVLNKVTSTT